MPFNQNQMREIRPAVPGGEMAELLALTLARAAPLEAGDGISGAALAGEWVIAAAVRGSVVVNTGSRCSLLQPGQTLVFQEPGPFEVQAVSDCLSGVIQMRGELPGRVLRDRLVQREALFHDGASMVRETIMSLIVMENERGPVDGGAASAKAYDLLVKLAGLPVDVRRTEPSSSPLVESAIGIIQEEFPFLEGLDELAQRLEVSKSHLIRAFTKQTGIPPGKYITKVRIDYAKLLLEDVDASITYVAEASGFANANYFAKVFRRETGMSPSEYLESAPRRSQPVHRQTPPIW
ncbi:MAG: helix-turn-helix transcriptional regulator [Oscillibacter sp.]|nr:helix-turn-helix transcriptional regulator [Oscillibacter sp.]